MALDWVAAIPWSGVVAASLLIMLDWFSGVVVAVVRRELTSSAMREGLLRKSLLFVAIALGVVIKAFFATVEMPDSVAGMLGIGQVMAAFGVEVAAEIPVCLFVCTAIVAMEAFSILENVAKVNKAAEKLLERFRRPDEKEEAE